MQPQVPSSVEEVVLIEPDPVPGADLPQKGEGGAAGIVLGLLLIFLAILIGTANLARERPWVLPDLHRRQTRQVFGDDADKGPAPRKELTIDRVC